jgi:hypothetical protein
VKPGNPADTLADRYAPNSFTQRSSFDLGNRLRTRSTGLADPDFLVNGKSEETYTYSARGALRTIGSSYGTMVSDFQFTASGDVLRAKYGDAAGTITDLYYDSRERLPSGPAGTRVVVATRNLSGPGLSHGDIANKVWGIRPQFRTSMGKGMGRHQRQSGSNPVRYGDDNGPLRSATDAVSLGGGADEVLYYLLHIPSGDSTHGFRGEVANGMR